MDRDARITGRLLRWFTAHRRDLPWRRTTDPYAIWISEIMLQQTRAQAVIPYYEKFLARFPTAPALAAATEAEVLAEWSGLGYYSRARNLRQAAIRIGASPFPASYDAIRALPGIGDYTAAAIASIAFHLPHAALDGNVIRVLARFLNDAGDIQSPATRRRLQQAADALLDRRRPGDFNQAMMELGATICLPKTPQCRQCPLSLSCQARRQGTAAQLPIRLRQTEAVQIAMQLVVVRRRSAVLLWQRKPKSQRMAGFWELPSPDQLPGLRETKIHGEFRHTITNHHFRVEVQTGEIDRIPKGLQWIKLTDLHQVPLSTTARKALRQIE